MSEVILVGGSRDGFVTEAERGMQTINNISLNADKTGPEYVDLYVLSELTDREGRKIYVHLGRYDAEESKTYWERMPDAERQQLIDAATELEAETKAAEEAANAAKEAESTDNVSGESGDESASGTNEVPDSEAQEESGESASEDTSASEETTGEQGVDENGEGNEAEATTTTESGSESETTDASGEAVSTDEVTEVPEDTKE